MKNVMLLTGAGQIGMAIARRMGAGMKIVIGDKKLENAQAIAGIMEDAGFDTVPMEMDLSSRDSILALIAAGKKYGPISMLVNAVGVSPSQAPIEAILKVDLYGTAVLLEEVGRVIAPGGAALSAKNSPPFPATAGSLRKNPSSTYLKVAAEQTGFPLSSAAVFSVSLAGITSSGRTSGSPA